MIARNFPNNLNIRWNRRGWQLASLLLLLTGLLLTGCNMPYLTATPNPLGFGLLPFGQSKDLTLSVKLGPGSMGETVTGGSIAVNAGANPGDFQIVSQSIVGNTGTQSAVIRFKPTAIGPRSATLTIIGTGPSRFNGDFYVSNHYTRTVTLTGYGAAPIAALAGAALQFDGATSRVTVLHNNALNAFPFTVEAWVNTKQTAGDAIIASKFAPGSDGGWYLALHNGLLTAAYFRDNANDIWDGGKFTFTGGNVADGQWHHVAFIVDNAGGRLYLDGVLNNTLAWTGTPGPCATTNNVALGAFADGSSPFAGQLDEVRLWNVARPSGQIQVNMRATQKENESGLLAYYRLDEGKGTIIADATAHHFNGTLSGSVTWLSSTAPVDAVIVAPGQSRTFQVAGFDDYGKTLAFAPSSLPAYGTLNVRSPIMTYAPGANFTVADTFTYTASNGALVSNPATVRLLYRTPGVNTLRVPAQYATLQAAVDASGTGDTILVGDGTYSGAGNVNVDFRGKGLTLKSMSGSAACIIDCQQKGRALFLSGGETGASRIEGFTIQNGSVINFNGGVQTSAYGGGILAYSNPTVANCLFLNNHTGNNGGGGGGMYGGTAVNCIFTGNYGVFGGAMWGGTATNCTFAQNRSDVFGGGMYGGTAINCAFTGNTAAQGGGMWAGNNVAEGGGMVSGEAINCVFTGNIAADGGGGMSDGTATNCVFAGNSANVGGGLYYDGRWSKGVTATNCTLVGNSAAWEGGGIIFGNQKFILTNCVVWGNASPVDPQICIYDDTYTTLTVTNSDVGGGYAGTGNLNADPLFVNATNGDYRLQSGSPCIDAATTAGVTLPATDLDGNPRILGNAPDMGAYEFVSRRFSGKLTFEGLVPNAAPQNVRFQLRPLNGGTPIDLTVLVPASGEFSFGLPSQAFTLWIKSDKYLATTVSLPNTGRDISGLTPLLRAGDATNDNSVDIFDFMLLAQSYLLSVGDPGYDARADFNGDGSVDVFDFVLLAQNYFLDGDQ